MLLNIDCKHEFLLFIIVFFCILSTVISYKDILFDEDSIIHVQPDEVDDAHFEKWNIALCTRNCKEGDPPRICYYRFILEQYSTMGRACGLCPKNVSACVSSQCVSADGHERVILAVNRRLPGPSIQVCQGDVIVVDVKNMMLDRGTAIHWHGIRQIGTPYMDGVPMVTQCPIQPGQIFRYKFKAEQPGTYFWHSHDGLQKMDGIIGSLIIRQPFLYEPNSDKYDKDLPSHVVLITDWMHQPADEKLPGPLKKDIGQAPDTYLINGKGYYKPTLFTDGIFETFSTSKTPISKFVVKHGLRYRFRFIGGSCLSCPFQVYIEDHHFLVISTDSDSIQPVFADTLVISSGDRFDVVIEANKPIGYYWIIVQGLERCVNAKQLGVLFYETADLHSFKPINNVFNNSPRGVVLNPINSNCTDVDNHKEICLDNLNSWSTTPSRIRKLKPDIELYLKFRFHLYLDNELFQPHKYQRYFHPTSFFPVSSLVNNVSNTLPPSPLLSQYYDIPNNVFCSEECIFTKKRKNCQCLNVIKIPLGSVVEFIIVDATHDVVNLKTLSHPFHLHGFEFYVLELGILTEKYFEEDLRKLNERLKSRQEIRTHLPRKDTIDVPASGYAVTRIVANNPGFWLLHCHYIYHLVTGMSIILQVGELHEMPPLPINFPKCGDFLSPIS